MIHQGVAAWVVFLENKKTEKQNFVLFQLHGFQFRPKSIQNCPSKKEMSSVLFHVFWVWKGNII
jgi:hypothetical protein